MIKKILTSFLYLIGAKQENAIRQAEKEKTLLIEELSSQNSRLTEQIQEAHNTEMKLMSQIQQLKDQYTYRNTSLQVILLIIHS